MRHLLSLILVFSLTAILLHPIKTHSESLSVSLQVGTTQINFSGYASPSSFIVIKEGSTTIASTTANTSGIWSTTLNVTVPGIHTYTIHATDTSNRQSSPIEYTLNVVGNTTTTISNIVISPTVSLSLHLLSGSAYPLANLTLLVSTGSSYSFTAGSDGSWSFDLSSFSSGTHTLTLTATVASSYLSLESIPLIYLAEGATSSSSQSSTSTASPTPSKSPSSLTSPSPHTISTPFFIKIYDLDHNGKLTKPELIDIIKAWLQKLLICDLNHDQRCNLVDLSILLYYIEP